MQDTILEAVKAYADLSLKIKNIKFNNENTDLFERQVGLIIVDYKKEKLL